MSDLTTDKVRAIFHSIYFGVGGHGSFLKNLANAVMSADGDNFKILKPSLEEIIEKYNLNRPEYLADNYDGA